MARKISVEIVGDASSLERAFKKSSRSAKNFQGDMQKTHTTGRRTFGGLGRVAGFAAGAIGTYGLAQGVRAVVGELGEAQKVGAQTGAVIKSTGGAANVSAKHVNALAESLLNKSGVDDEVIKSGENMLLTFRDIRNEAGKGNDIFDQATKATLDLSVATGKDMVNASVLVGKALNDPVKGLTALRRVGVQFTDAQEDQIKALVKSGRTMDAQKIILRELQTEFGGSARAAGQTLPGKLNILRNTLLNVGATIAAKLTPEITKVVDRMVKWLTNTKNQEKIINAFKAAASALGAVLRTLNTVFQTLSRLVGGNENAIKLLVVAFASFKILSIAGSVATLAGSFGGVTTALVSPAGLVAATGLAAFGLTTLILKVTGLDKKLYALGGTIYDVATKLRLFGAKDPMAEFAGKLIPKPADMRFIARSLARLQAGGLTRAQAITRFAQQHPGVARHDIVVAGGIHLHGVQNVPQLKNELQKQARQRTPQRRGGR